MVEHKKKRERIALYRIGDSTYRSNDVIPWLQALETAYKTKTRPLCMCQIDGVPMYVAKIQGNHVLKRMPNTGNRHAATCDSFEPPPELSGLGQVLGTAILDNPDDGTTAVKLDFSLTKGATRAAPVPSGVEPDTVKTDGSKLSLRGVLHYLWEDAGFNRWSPAMDGKRSWAVLRRHLLHAAETKRAKGMNLAEAIYMPEPFVPDDKEQITQRRMAMLTALSAVGTARRLMVCIAEVKQIEKSRFGHRVIFKQLPDCHFMMNDDLTRRLSKRFNVELGLWDHFDESRLVMVGTFGVGGNGVPTLEEVALMIVTDNWIPFDNVNEKYLLDKLTSHKRSFIKGLRYNLPSSQPLACAVLTDTHPKATAMYVAPPGASDDYVQTTQTLIAESELGVWEWPPNVPNMPPLPDINDE